MIVSEAFALLQHVIKVVTLTSRRALLKPWPPCLSATVVSGLMSKLLLFNSSVAVKMLQCFFFFFLALRVEELADLQSFTQHAGPVDLEELWPILLTQQTPSTWGGGAVRGAAYLALCCKNRL